MCAVTRTWKCWMRKRSWDGVYRVGTDLTALFAIVLQAGRNFAQATDFHDFQPVKERPYQNRPPLCPFRLLPLPTCS